MRSVKLLIGGADRAASDGKTFDLHSPVSGEIVSRAAAATLEDADAAVAAASAAFPAWVALSPGGRRMKLLAAADEMDARAAEFVAVGVEETGGTAGWYHF